MLVFQSVTDVGQFVQKSLGITLLYHRVSQMFADRPFGSHHEVGFFLLTSNCRWLSHTTESY